MSQAFTYFISDLHLSAQREDITECFVHFMQHEAPQAQTLYILGDLFEAWIGDDDITPFSNTIAATIADVSKKIPVYFIHGNRDFAIREGFAKRAGMTLLPEQVVIDLYGRRTLISHGDELCTRDIEYQKFRKKARGWWWPRLMLALPLSMRRKIAERGRVTSQNNQKQLTADIMDVTPSEVEKAMRSFDVSTFIHGHTHRPDIHNFVLDGKPRQRIVLGDWYDQGSILRAQSDTLALETRPFQSQ
ncbi:UDP-2,3-diacylglucosamine diphosphatase [Glaciecola sp. XM2]|uniref:UDP-2,3-diacylglucosamine diphosphatase n=1 Tax=Glaciecola sp. XM2 TaxID=1914931 RepID=UPI001BDF4617|nr:UDP-2,3-diacylglucosamine diphosphatase [Glaciecola sp. XM2]MBT1452071.1 UDP-2,3-diacylglucosamine diphosphatase [Glaciecola sp. XM2]